MAVTTYWLGTTDGNWMEDGNWSGVHPAATDTAIFDARCPVDDVTYFEPDEGMLIAESGHVDHAALALLHFKEGYTGGLATAAEPLCTSPAKLIIEGSGTYYIACGLTNADTDTTIATTIINNPNATVYLYSYTNDDVESGAVAKFTTVHVLAGKVYLAYKTGPIVNTGCAVSTLYVSPRNNKATNVDIKIEKDAYNLKGAGEATSIYMSNGTLRTDSAIATLELKNGTVYYGSEPATETAVTEADMDIATLIMYGGRFHWYPDDSGSDATITTAHIYGGTFDASVATAHYSPEIGKIITTMYAHPGAIVNLDNNMATIDVPALYNYGANVTFDKGIKLDIDPVTVYNKP